MKAFILDRYGGADGVRAGDVPDPELREDDVVIEVHAAGVNLLDSKIRNGEFKRILPYRLPLILGHDVVGIVVRSDLECDDSNPATKSMRTFITPTAWPRRLFEQFLVSLKASPPDERDSTSAAAALPSLSQSP
jgi:NADPH:quinone reductase-like Zn-dependent oxidoreductase